MDRYRGTDMRLTKCVTIRNFESEIPAEPPMKWVECFDVTSKQRQPLCNLKPSDWQSTDVSHVLLNIDIPNQQPYHLPLLIMPVHCVYLILFDLRYPLKSLTRIHNVMKNVYTVSSFAAKVEGTEVYELPPKVFLVGMHAEESNKSEERRHFSQKLSDVLEKKPYGKLIVCGSEEPFWAVDGENMGLNGTDHLLEQQKQYFKSHAEVHQWILCHHELQEKFKDDPCILYCDLKVAAMLESLQFDAFLQFLHKYGFVFYHPVVEMKEAQVILLQPQYLCKLFAKVSELSKSRSRTTIADLLSSSAADIERRAEYKQWFQRICIDMGLVFEVTKAETPDFVFLMGLKAGPKCPDHEFYSAPPLLVTFKGSGGEQVKEECLLPSHFFAAFVTEFLRTLTQSYREQRKPNQQVPLPSVKSMEQQYIHVKIAGTHHVHVVERECCVEVAFQYVAVPGHEDQEAKQKLQKLIRFCSRIKQAVTGSADNILQRLKLTKSSLCYGVYYSCETEDGTFDNAFGEYTYNPDDEKWILQCSYCVLGVHTTSPLQDIWFQDQKPFPFDEVCLKTVPFQKDVNIWKLCEAPPSDLQTPEPPTSDAVSEPPQTQPGQALLALLSQSVTKCQDYRLLLRDYVSRKAARKARAVLEGVGLDAPTIAICFVDHPSNVEETVQEGLMRWCDGKGRQPPTWGVLLAAMDYAQIEQQYVQGLKEKLEATLAPPVTSLPAPSETVTGAYNSHFEGDLSLPDGPSPSKPPCVSQEPPCRADCADRASSDPAKEMSAMLVPSYTITAEQVLDQFRAWFIKDVDANAIVLELKHKNIIADGDERDVSQKHDKTQQNQILHDRLRQKCTNEALMTVCEVLVNVRGNPKMNALGAGMKSMMEGHTKSEVNSPPSGGVSGASTSQLEGAQSLSDEPSPSNSSCVPQEPPPNPPSDSVKNVPSDTVTARTTDSTTSSSGWPCSCL